MDTAVRKTVIKKTGQWPTLQLDAVWHARELIQIFAWRDLNIRYRQTVLGMAWAIVQPLMMMIIFSVMFGKLGKFPSEGLPYPLFSYCGLLIWQYFFTAVTSSCQTLVNNPQLLSKIYFPRLVMPFANLVPPIVDFGVASLLLVGLAAFFRTGVAATVVLTPIFVVLTMMITLGTGLWLSSLSVKYRDFKYLTPFLLSIWMYITPVAYPITIIPPQYKLLSALNPMAWAVEGFRDSLFGTGTIDWLCVGISFASASIILVGGLYCFRAIERSFAERI